MKTKTVVPAIVLGIAAALGAIITITKKKRTRHSI